MSLRSFARFCGVVGCGSLVLLGAGCRGGGSPPTPDSPEPPPFFGGVAVPREPNPADSTSPTGVSCNHEYYPLRLGYHIQYKVTFPPVNGKDTSYYALRVAEVTDDSVYVKASYKTDAEPVDSDIVYKCIDGSLQAAGYFDTGSKIPGGPIRNQFRIRTDSASGQFLPPHIARGDTWEAKFMVKVTPVTPLNAEGSALEIPDEEVVIRDPISMPITISRTALGIERVTVPAGTFDAMKIKTTTKFDVNVAMSGTEWWVKEVGMVKSTYDAGSGVENIVTVARGVTVPGHIDIPSADIPR